MHKNTSKKMRSHVIGSIAAATLLLCFATVASAQEEGHKWTGNVGVGYTPLLGALNQRLDNGWNVSFGAGYHFTEHFSLGGQVMYNGLGVSRGLLNELSVPNGNAHIWAFTAEPRLTFRARHSFTPYVIGGVGYYRRTVQFTQPTIAAIDVFDPFFGFFPALIPANEVIGRVIRDGIGGNGGLGFQAPVGHRGVKIFGEVRYHYSNGGGIPTRMIPMTIGVRF